MRIVFVRDRIWSQMFKLYEMFHRSSELFEKENANFSFFHVLRKLANEFLFRLAKSTSIV